MSVAAVVTVAILVFIYTELAIGTGYYMFLVAGGTDSSKEAEEKKQIKKYSITAGVFFPVTFAILVAGNAAGRKGKK